jgi:hypothetical protein
LKKPVKVQIATFSPFCIIIWARHNIIQVHSLQQCSAVWWSPEKRYYLEKFVLIASATHLLFYTLRKENIYYIFLKEQIMGNFKLIAVVICSVFIPQSGKKYSCQKSLL